MHTNLASQMPYPGDEIGIKFLPRTGWIALIGFPSIMVITKRQSQHMYYQFIVYSSYIPFTVCLFCN